MQGFCKIQRSCDGSSQKGFTLIELMVVVVVAAILAAIAYPSYQNYVMRAKRAEGRATLLDAAAKEERYYSDANQYGTLADAGISSTSESGYYSISISRQNANQNFTLTATPASFADNDCGALTLSNAGDKDNGGTEDTAYCWGK